MVAKRSASPGLIERPSKRQMTSSPEEGELEETESGHSNSGLSLTKSPPGPPPTGSISTTAPPKFKVAFPFKKSKPANQYDAASLQPAPVPASLACHPGRSPSRSSPDSPPPKQHRLPPARDDYRRGASPHARKRGFDRYIPDDYNSYDSRRGYDRRDRGGNPYYPPNEPSLRYDSYRPNYLDERRPQSRSRTNSRSRSRSRRSRSPYRRGHPRSPSPRTTRSPTRTHLSPRSITPTTHAPPSAAVNFSPPSQPRTTLSPPNQPFNGFSPPTKPASPSNALPPPPPPSTRLHTDRPHIKIATAKPAPPSSAPSSAPPAPPVKPPAAASSPRKPGKYTPRRPPHGLRSADDDLKHYGRAFKGCSSLSAYIVATKVGEGTFGEVHKATHKETGQAVALKRILMHNEKEGMPITALREIRILKKLNHQNVVRLREVVIEILSGRDKEKEAGKLFGAARAFYMVFPYMDHDLAGLLENERVQMTTSQIKLYMKQLLEGTAYLHANNIVHRDMKAANLLISNEGLLQIADFGLARPFDPNIVLQGRRNGEGPLPRYTNCVVTRWYRPPELFLGARRYGGEIDIWGIGCVLGEMFTRRPLLMGSSDSHQLDLIWELCGTPSGGNWPGYDDLPGLDGVKRWKVRTRVLKDKYQPMGAETVDLLDKLLTLDPARRITAVAALDHDWFWTDPVPANPKSLPKYESSHEIDKRNKRNYQQPPPAPIHVHVPQAIGAPPNIQGLGPRALPPPMSNPTYKMNSRQGHGGQHQQHQQYPPLPPQQEQQQYPQLPPGAGPGYPSFGAPPPPGAHQGMPPYPYPPPPQFGYPAPGPGVAPPGWHSTAPPGWAPPATFYPPPPGSFPVPPHGHPHHAHQQYPNYGYRGEGRDRDGDGSRRKTTLGPPPGTNGLPPKPVGSLVPTPHKRAGRSGGGGALPYD